MRRWAKFVVRVLVVVVAVSEVFAGAMYGSAWYYRWRAGQMLAVIKTMTPGVTTEAEYLRAVKPWQSLPNQQDVAHPGDVEISNYPDWIDRVCFVRLTETVCGYAMLLRPVETSLVVSPVFANGQLAYVGIREGQWPMRSRCCVFVQIYSKGYESTDAELLKNFELPKNFEGYYVGPFRDAAGMFLTAVTLDERATVAERNDALNFSFECFTTYLTCQDGAQFLRPKPNRPTHAVKE